MHGLAVDNVLQLAVVLANGSAVTASRCQNPDLFWALRGGGGSSFGVVTQCVYKLHANAPVAGVQLEVALLRGEGSFAALLDAWLYVSNFYWRNASYTGVVMGGYYFFDLSKSVFTAQIYFNGTTAQADQALTPIGDWAKANPLDVTIVAANVDPFPSLHSWHSSWDPTSEATGSVAVLGSRLIPYATMADDGPRADIALNLTEIATYIGVIECLATLGGEAALLDPAGTETSSTPAWRSSGLHVVLGAGWALNATLAEQAATTTGISELTDMLRVQLPASGAYWGESDRLEPQWQQSFWGAKNYARLQAIKKAYDPAGIFSCWHCVELA